MATAEKEKGRRRRFQIIHVFTCGRQEKSFFLPPSPHLCLCVNLSLSCWGNSFDFMAHWDLTLRILYFLIGSYLQSSLQISRALMKPTLQNATCGFGFSCLLHVSGLHGLAEMWCLQPWLCVQVLEMQKILENQHKLQKPEQESKTHPSMQHY